MEASTQNFLLNNWYRLPDGVLGGVFAGISDKFEIDPLYLRIAFVASFFFLGFGLLAYFLLWISLPPKVEGVISTRKVFLGVCTRLHYKFEVDIAIIRLLVSIMVLTSFGITIIFYFLLHFLLEDPNEDTDIIDI